MKIFRALTSLAVALTLAATLAPTANTFADGSMSSWGNPSYPYGHRFNLLYGNLSDSGLGNPDGRPAVLDRWQAQFDENLVSHTTFAKLDTYDVYDIQKVYDTDNFATRSGYGLLPQAATDKITDFVRNMANGNPQYVLNIVQGWNDPSKDDGFYLLDDQPYIRMSKIVELSGGKLERLEATPANDPSQVNGTAYFQVSPWPRITTAAVQGDTIHVEFVTYGLNLMHHPVAHLSNGIDTVDKDFGLAITPIFNGTWDIPVDQVTQKLGPLDKLSVIVEDGYGRTATAPLKPGAVMTYHWMADYTVPYTAGQPASFTQPLTLTLDQVPATIDPKQLSDTFSWSYSVDGSGWQPLTVLPDVAKVFDASGKPKQKIVIDTNTLNTIPGRQWGGGAHKIQIKVSASPGDAGQYMFSSADSGGPGPEAIVTVTFAETGQITTPIQTQMGNGLLNIMWPNSHPDSSSPTGRAMGGLPDQVNPCGTFVAPIEITNTSESRTITTTVDFVIDGTIVIKRTFESKDGSPPPPPQYMSFPLHGAATKTFTIPPKMHVYWDVGFGNDRNVTYTIEGYEGPTVGPNYHDEVLCSFIRLPETTEEGPIGPLVGPLDVGMPATRSANSYDPVPNYAVHIQAIPRDPEDYVHSPIDEWIGVTQSMPHSRVHLVQ